MGSSDYKHGYGDKVGEMKVLRKKKIPQGRTLHFGEIAQPPPSTFLLRKNYQGPFLLFPSTLN